MNYNDDEDIIIKISDFGFARELSSKSEDFEVGGTKPYMAPECFKGIFSTESDVYAVGVIFYLLLTASFPYKIDEYEVEDIVEGRPWNKILKLPSLFDENIPKFIDKIVMKSIQKDPEKRYKDANEFIYDLEIAIDTFKEYAYYQDYLSDKRESKEEQEYYYDYILNDNILEAFRLTKMEDGLDEASSILEKEVLKDYEIRKTYAKTLRLWKGDYPDAKLISEAFTVTLKEENYKLAIDLLNEAFAYNPILKESYGHFINLCDLFIDLEKDKDLKGSIEALDKLMERDDRINEIYKDSIDILRTCDKNTILEESIALSKKNKLVDSSKLLEFLVVSDDDIRKDYAYKLSLYKQDVRM